jgi:hypothetical protein
VTRPLCDYEGATAVTEELAILVTCELRGGDSPVATKDWRAASLRMPGSA